MDKSQSIEWNVPFPIEIRHIPLKRFFDLFFSLLVLLIGFPIFLCIGLIIRLTSKGQAIYAQERIGRGGRPFRCYKFRTMYRDADARLNKLLTKDPALAKEWLEKCKLAKDPRITLFGSFLRKTSLDELPQFWNVLKGDLSLVGPRPVVQTELKRYYGLKAAKILAIRPGLTGIWQVSGRSNVSYAMRVEMDELYVDSQNLLLDIKLIALTIPVMLSAKGAY